MIRFLHGFFQYAIYRFLYNTLSRFLMGAIGVYGIAYMTGDISSPSELLSYFQHFEFSKAFDQLRSFLNF